MYLKINKGNYEDVLHYDSKCPVGLLSALLDEIEEINKLSKQNESVFGKEGIGLHLSFNTDDDDIDFTKFKIKSDNICESESIGTSMTVKELDYAICAIHDLTELLVKGKIE